MARGVPGAGLPVAHAEHWSGAGAISLHTAGRFVAGLVPIDTDTFSKSAIMSAFASLPSPFMPAARRLDLFCRVVDNYGDIGICWRLARQLHSEHGLAVCLWVDDLASFRRICPQVDTGRALQQIAGVTVRHWPVVDGDAGAAVPVFQVDDVADIVIEFFAVDIPPAYIAAMAQRSPRPVWLNLEGLTAEDWVEGCHQLPSTHPATGLVKHFYFPGFNTRTGGLLREKNLLQQRDAFQADPDAQEAFLARCGLSASEINGFKVSLFCYPHAPVAALLDAWEKGPLPVTCLVPEGVASDAVRAFLASCEGTIAHPARAGGAADGAGSAAMEVVGWKGKLTVRVLPFLPQADYDKLLWACDLNFVRGEDSFVRAQWAGKPFVWHIYPQDENLHHKKLRAFLACYAEANPQAPAAAPPTSLPALAALSLAWNGVQPSSSLAAQWAALYDEIPTISARAADWECQMQENGDLASNLLGFSSIMLGS